MYCRVYLKQKFYNLNCILMMTCIFVETSILMFPTLSLFFYLNNLCPITIYGILLIIVIIIVIIIKTFIPILDRRYKSSFERFKYPHMCNYINIIQRNKYNCSVQ